MARCKAVTPDTLDQDTSHSLAAGPVDGVKMIDAARCPKRVDQSTPSPLTGFALQFMVQFLMVSLLTQMAFLVPSARATGGVFSSLRISSELMRRTRCYLSILATVVLRRRRARFGVDALLLNQCVADAGFSCCSSNNAISSFTQQCSYLVSNLTPYFFDHFVCDDTTTIRKGSKTIR